jgi:hypothetical protein
MKSVLITGAAGDVGTRLRKLLKGVYPQLRISDVREPADLGEDEHFVPADLADYAQVEHIVAGVDGIVHLGGFSVEGPWETIHRAAETGDMASIPGHIIPCLALGIPGSAPSAVLMSAMIIHGIQPGPMMMIDHPQFVYDVVAMTTLAMISILIFGLFLERPLLVVMRVKRTILMPIISCFARSAHLRLGFGRSARQEPPARPGALGWQPVAVFHPADLHRICIRDHHHHAALRAGG